MVKNIQILINPYVPQDFNIKSNIVTRSQSSTSSEVSLENSNGFVFSFGIESNMRTFIELNYSTILVADATHNIIKDSKLKLFSVCYFDEMLNRIPIFFIILASESKLAIRNGLSAFKE